jgi:hypothetical protein
LLHRFLRGPRSLTRKQFLLSTLSLFNNLAGTSPNHQVVKCN